MKKNTYLRVALMLFAWLMFSSFSWGKKAKNPVEVYSENVNKGLIEVAKLEADGRWQEAYDTLVSMCDTCEYLIWTNMQGVKFDTSASAKKSEAYANYELSLTLKDIQADIAKIKKIEDRPPIIMSYSQSNSDIVSHLSYIQNHFREEKRAEEEKIKAQKYAEQERLKAEQKKEEDRKKQEERIAKEIEAEGKKEYGNVKKIADRLVLFKNYYALLPEKDVKKVQDSIAVVENKDYRKMVDAKETLSNCLKVLVSTVIKEDYPLFYNELQEEGMLGSLDSGFLGSLENGMDFVKGDEYLLHNLWFKIVKDTESSKKSFFDVSCNIEVGDIDLSNEKYSYKVTVKTVCSPIFESIRKGYRKAYKSSWKDLPKGWGAIDAAFVSQKASLKAEAHLKGDFEQAFVDAFRNSFRRELGYDFDEYMTRQLMKEHGMDPAQFKLDETSDFEKEVEINMFTSDLWLQLQTSQEIKELNEAMNSLLGFYGSIGSQMGLNINMKNKARVYLSNFPNSLYWIKMTLSIDGQEQSARKVSGFVEIPSSSNFLGGWNDNRTGNTTSFEINDLSKSEFDAIRKGKYSLRVDGIDLIYGKIDFTKDDLGGEYSKIELSCNLID